AARTASHERNSIGQTQLVALQTVVFPFPSRLESSARRRKIVDRRACVGHERVEQSLRNQIVLPSHLRVPLNGKNESIRTRIFKRFNHTISTPRGRDGIGAQRIDRLMMMTV